MKRLVFFCLVPHCFDVSKEADTRQHLHHKHHASTTGPHGPKRDLAMMGVLIHVLGDAGNNLGVMAAALVIWLAHYGGRFYADPAASMGIALMILASSIPLSKHYAFPRPLVRTTNYSLVKQAGLILLQSAPSGVDHDDVKHDLEKVSIILPHMFQLCLTLIHLLAIGTWGSCRS